MEKLKVDQSKCIGCGACVGVAPTYFDFNDNGLSEAIKQDELENEEVHQAIEMCPVNAITKEEVEEQKEEA